MWRAWSSPCGERGERRGSCLVRTLGWCPGNRLLEGSASLRRQFCEGCVEVGLLSFEGRNEENSEYRGMNKH